MPGRAPVEKVGGPQDSGPWPADVEEIVESKAYKRPVQLSDGSTQEIPVTVTNITELVRGGYAVSMTYDDPTLGGGGQ